MRYLLFGLLVLNCGVLLFGMLERVRPADAGGYAAGSGGQQLDLLSEISGSPGAAPSAAVQRAETGNNDSLRVAETGKLSLPANAPEADLKTCLVFGPISSEADVEEVRRMLLGYQLPVEQSLSQADGQRDYWVIIPVHDSREAALATVARFEKVGIESFPINQGEYKNGVSLGLFSQAQAAETFAEARRADGIEGIRVEVIKLDRSTNEYRLTVREQIGPPLRKEILALMQARTPPVEHKEIICK